MNSALIPSDEVEFHPTSYNEPDARVFFWRGDLYRGLAGEPASVAAEVLRSDVVKRLIRERKLVQTEITSLTLPPFDLVLKHERLPVVSYVHEWCFDAIRDAAVLVLELQQALMRDGLELGDPHPWNIVFNGSAPVFVDFGAILLSRRTWHAGRTFEWCLLNSLRLLAAGHARIARALIRYPDGFGVSDDEVAALLGFGAGRRVPERVRSIARRALPAAVKALLGRGVRKLRPGVVQKLEATRSEILHLDLPPEVRDGTEWAGSRVPHDLNAFRGPVEKIIADCRPGSLLELDAGKPWFAPQAARMGSRVIAIGTAETSANARYRAAKDEKLDIQSLVMSAYCPSGGAGAYGREYPPATSRLRSEMVVALAPVPEIVVSGYVSFEKKAEALSEFSERWLLVPFFGKDSLPPDNWKRECEWYTLETFKSAMGQRFRQITEHRFSSSSPVLLVCEK